MTQTGQSPLANPSAEVFRCLIETSRDPFFIISPQQGFQLVYANAATREFLGYSAEETLQLRVPDWDPSYTPERLEQLWRELQQRGSLLFRASARTCSGRQAPLEVSLSLLELEGQGYMAGHFRDISDSLQAQEHLLERERELETLLESSLAIPWRVNFSTQKFVYIGYQIEPLLGYPLESWRTYQDWADRVHPEDRQAAESYCSLETEAGRDHVLEYRSLTQSGEVVWIRDAVALLRNSKGEVTDLVGHFLDVTQTKLAELALRRSEAHLRTLIESLPDLVWLKDAEGVYLGCNQKFERFFGAPEAEIIGKTDYDFVDRELADFFRKHDRLAMQAGKPSVNEEELVFAADGHREIVEVIKTPINNAHGDLIGVLGVARDITQRKQMELALKEGLETYQSAINTPGLGFWVVDPSNGNLLEANEAYARQSGYSCEELSQMSIPQLDALEKPEETTARIEHIKRAGFARFRTVQRRKDGSTWPVEVVTTYSPVQGGRFFVFIEDITEKKRDEESLQQHRNHLEELVAERTAELQASRDAAERASRAKSEFLSSMSHELRTPLNAILGFGQLLEYSQPGLSELQREHLQEILSAGYHLLDLINDVLDLARIDAGSVVINPQPVAVRPLLEECMTSLGPRMEAQELQFEPLDGCALGLFVQADPLRLKQVMLNLLSNAVNYNRRGGRVHLSCQQPSDETLRLMVRDTGKGISQHKQPQLFTAFNRLGAEGSSVQGSGIGLVISKNLVEMMGGQMGFSSEEGQGSCFWVDLPRLEQAAEQAAVKTAKPADAALPSLPGCRILYIEDNPANVRLVQRLMSRFAGHQLDIAEDGLEGLERASSQVYEVLLIDINLPSMSGLEIVQRLRQLDQYRQTPMIALSADAMQSEIDRAKQVGFDHYVTKPIDIPAFIRLLESCLAKEVGS
ncbi:MAG: PAS domain S-box protein [Gammaproteobacteria bacterium]|nr:PAS domain S-box protein [Gammaproteobacteria bacterium]